METAGEGTSLEALAALRAWQAHGVIADEVLAVLVTYMQHDPAFCERLLRAIAASSGGESTGQRATRRAADPLTSFAAVGVPGDAGTPLSGRLLLPGEREQGEPTLEEDEDGGAGVLVQERVSRAPSARPPLVVPPDLYPTLDLLSHGSTDDLQRQLATYTTPILRRIIQDRQLDPGRYMAGRRTPEELVAFIAERLIKRATAGQAFVRRATDP